MCNWADVIEERGLIKGQEEVALRMIAGGKLSLDEIASYTDLPLERVQELAGKKTA